MKHIQPANHEYILVSIVNKNFSLSSLDLAMTELIAELEEHYNALSKELLLVQKKKDSLKMGEEINEYITNKNRIIDLFVSKRRIFQEAMELFQQKHEIDSQLNEALQQKHQSTLLLTAKSVLSPKNLKELFDEKGALHVAKIIQKYCSVAGCSELVAGSKQFLHEAISAHLKTLFTWSLSEDEFRATISQSFSLLFREIFVNCLTEWKYETVFEEMIQDLSTFISTWPSFCTVYSGNVLEVKNQECVGWNDSLDDDYDNENSNLSGIEKFCNTLGIDFNCLTNLSVIPFTQTLDSHSKFLFDCQKLFSSPSECIKICSKKENQVPADFPKRDGNLFLLLVEERDFLVRDLFVEYVILIEQYCSQMDDNSHQTLVTSAIIAFSNDPIDLESACYRFNEVQCFIQTVSRYNSERIPSFFLNWLIDLVEITISQLKLFLPSAEDELNSLAAITECHELLAVWIKGASACMITADLLSTLYEAFIVSLFMNENQSSRRIKIIEFCNQFVEFLQLYPQVEPFLQSEIVLGILKEISQLLQTNPKDVYSIAADNFHFLTKSHVKSLLKNVFSPVAG